MQVNKIIEHIPTRVRAHAMATDVLTHVAQVMAARPVSRQAPGRPVVSRCRALPIISLSALPTIHAAPANVLDHLRKNLEVRCRPSHAPALQGRLVLCCHLRCVA